MKLYVGNLSFDTSEADLRSIFEQFGTVTETHIVSDRETGRSRGFAFLTMSNAAEGRAAIGTLHGKQFGGRALTVNEARPRETVQNSPFRVGLASKKVVFAQFRARCENASSASN